MRVRRPSDDPALTAMLAAEGLKVEEMVFSDNTTWVLEREGRPHGFFTIRPEWKMPHVVHFCTSKGYNGRRDIKDGWAMVICLKKILAAMGARKAIFNVPCRKKRLLSLIQRVFGGEVYGERSGHFFILTEVCHG